MMKSMVLLVMVVVFCGLSAIETVSADSYLIGAYSQYQLRYVNDTSARFTELAEKLSEGGFNAASTRAQPAWTPGGYWKDYILEDNIFKKLTSCGYVTL